MGGALSSRLFRQEAVIFISIRRSGWTPRVWYTRVRRLGFGASRFSDPGAPPTYRVYYAAEDLRTAFLETVVRDVGDGRAGPAVLSRDVVLNRCWAEITLTASLRVVDLLEDGCTRMGIDTDTTGARSHAQGQALSSVLHGHADAPDGILYRSRLSGRRNIVVFERLSPLSPRSQMD
jgi:hypothetical protein